MRFAILFSIFLIVGCQNQNKPTKNQSTSNTAIGDSIRTEEALPIKIDTPVATQKEDVIPSNDLLYEHPNYDIWNTLAYTPDGEVAQEALDFRDSVKDIGFTVSATEGLIFLYKDPEFLTLFSPFLSERLNSFLVEYKKDIIFPFTQDNSIIVSTDEHIRRMMFWEDFSKSHPDFELPEYANNEFRFLLFKFILGTGNSAIHDWGDIPKIRSEVIESYNRVISDYPNAISAKYLNFLEEQNFTWNRIPFNEYGRGKFPDMYGN